MYSGRNYTILGSETKTDLFGDAPASGQTIRIQGKPYLVIGVLQEKGSSGLFSGDRGAWVTLNYARANFSGTNPNYTLSVNAPSAETLDAVQGQCMALMRSVRKLVPKERDNFSITRSDSVAKSLIENLNMVTSGAFIIGSITLLGASIALSSRRDAYTLAQWT